MSDRSEGESSDVGGSEVQALQAERDRLADRQQEIMQLIECEEPDKLIHDLRNVLNELRLLRALLDKTDHDSSSKSE